MMDTVFEGGCTCGAVRYRMNRRPMIVHCCHCRWCQRESGSAFALNGMIEASELVLLQGEAPVVEQYYKAADYWSEEDMARYRKALGK